MAGPPLAVDNARPTIELYGPDNAVALWGDPASTWGDPLTTWEDGATAYSWHSVACEVSAFESSWGADEGSGALAQSAAGVLTLTTYDPDRLLDPSNLASPLVKANRIGSPVRLTIAPSGAVLGYGYLDELEYTFESSSGVLTAADDIATLAQAETDPAFWQPSNALTAFAAAAIASAGQAVPVGPPPAAGDPVIAYRDTRGQPVWALIRDAALDALCLAWIDRQTSPPTLRVTPYGYPTDNGLRLGEGGIAFAQLTSTSSASGVANVVDDATGELARGPSAVGRDQQFEVPRIEPAGPSWAGAILADRARATLATVPGDIYPSSMGELVQLATVRGLDLARIVWASEGIDTKLRIVGGSIAGEAGGVYRVRLAMYAPGSPWAYLPPPPATTAATPSSRSIRATKDSGIHRNPITGQPGTISTSGNGLGPIRVGGSSGAYGLNAGLFAFDPIDYTGIRRVRKVELVLVYDRASANPITFEVQRVAATWQEGRAPSSDSVAMRSNAVVWPGPVVDGPIVAGTLPVLGAGAELRVDITSIATVNLPIALGGRGYPEFGYRVLGQTLGGASDVWLAARDTVEDDPSNTGCRLELTVEV